MADLTNAICSTAAALPESGRRQPTLQAFAKIDRSESAVAAQTQSTLIPKILTRRPPHRFVWAEGDARCILTERCRLACFSFPSASRSTEAHRRLSVFHSEYVSRSTRSWALNRGASSCHRNSPDQHARFPRCFNKSVSGDVSRNVAIQRLLACS